MTSTSSRALCAGAAAVSLALSGAVASSTPAHAAIVREASPAPVAVPHLLTPHAPSFFTVRSLALAQPMNDGAFAATSLHTRNAPAPASRSVRRAPRRVSRVVHRAESASLSRREQSRPVAYHRSARSARPAARPVVYRANTRGMNAAVAYAYAQLGSSYVHGASGGGRFDCSGLTMRAFSRVGIRLPHSADSQAGMAHTVSRGAARPGDLVVGSGHVGIYVGNGYMIDAGNPRVGVSKRHLWSGLRVKRF